MSAPWGVVCRDGSFRPLYHLGGPQQRILASNVASTSRSTESMCRPGGRHYVLSAHPAQEPSKKRKWAVLLHDRGESALGRADRIIRESRGREPLPAQITARAERPLPIPPLQADERNPKARYAVANGCQLVLDIHFEAQIVEQGRGRVFGRLARADFDSGKFPHLSPAASGGPLRQENLACFARRRWPSRERIPAFVVARGQVSRR